MRTLVLSLIFSLFFSCLYAQDSKANYNLFKVHIGDNALMCPNLGPKLKTNIKQMGGEILLFDQEEDVMLVQTRQGGKISTIDYLSKIVELTGYPNELISVEEINEQEKDKLLNKKEK